MSEHPFHPYLTILNAWRNVVSIYRFKISAAIVNIPIESSNDTYLAALRNPYRHKCWGSKLRDTQAEALKKSVSESHVSDTVTFLERTWPAVEPGRSSLFFSDKRCELE